MRADDWAINEEDEEEEQDDSCDWKRSTERPVDDFSSRRQEASWGASSGANYGSKRSLLAPPSEHWDTTGASCRSPILSSRNKASNSPARADKHVRLTLPNAASPIPGAGGRLSLLSNGGLGSGLNLGPQGGGRFRRRRAVSTTDFKSCALVQSKLKLGDIM